MVAVQALIPLVRVLLLAVGSFLFYLCFLVYVLAVSVLNYYLKSSLLIFLDYALISGVIGVINVVLLNTDVKPQYSVPSAAPVSYAYQGTSKKIDIPNGRVGVIIGKGGETIKYLQTQSGAKIQVTRDMDADPSSQTRMVELMGTPDQIAAAEKLINEVLAEVFQIALQSHSIADLVICFFLCFIYDDQSWSTLLHWQVLYLSRLLEFGRVFFNHDTCYFLIKLC